MESLKCCERDHLIYDQLSNLLPRFTSPVSSTARPRCPRGLMLLTQRLATSGYSCCTLVRPSAKCEQHCQPVGSQNSKVNHVAQSAVPPSRILNVIITTRYTTFIPLCGITTTGASSQIALFRLIDDHQLMHR